MPAVCLRYANRGQRVFTADSQEAGIAAVTYAKTSGLEAGASSPAHLLLDTTLCDALFKVWFKMGTLGREERSCSLMKHLSLIRRDRTAGDLIKRFWRAFGNAFSAKDPVTGCS